MAAISWARWVFLKGPFKGHLLSVVTKDDNDNMYPIAFATIIVGTKDSWSWFLETLVSNLGHQLLGKCAFISDHQKLTLHTLMYIHNLYENENCD